MATTASIGPASGGVAISRVAISALYQFAAGSSEVIDYLVSNPYSNVRMDTFPLAAGENTLTRPTSPEPGGMILLPPTDNTETLELRKSTGVTGFALAPAAPTFIAFPAAGPGSNPIIQSGGTVSNFRVIWV